MKANEEKTFSFLILIALWDILRLSFPSFPSHDHDNKKFASQLIHETVSTFENLCAVTKSYYDLIFF